MLRIASHVQYHVDKKRLETSFVYNYALDYFQPLFNIIR